MTSRHTARFLSDFAFALWVFAAALGFCLLIARGAGLLLGCIVISLPVALLVFGALERKARGDD
ncbi:hypothetical protein VW35_02390 [Devosia soli]|uniref:Uncharacterized protein n=1 Tax=Devosia soli TaxID=361041 RepID=A0A0F5LHK2_9HYPH|nr:hypothetical protein [Devosia soli]KKB81037.1 hypothetical protein VW35_02390 [Devosia soli]